MFCSSCQISFGKKALLVTKVADPRSKQCGKSQEIFQIYSGCRNNLMDIV